MPDQPIREIDVHELRRRTESGEVVLLDVRQSAEYAQAHVAGALHLPLDELVDRLDEVPHAEELLVICARGGRSWSACTFLAAQGRVVANVAGGTLGWIEAGYEVVAGEVRAAGSDV